MGPLTPYKFVYGSRAPPFGLKPSYPGTVIGEVGIDVRLPILRAARCSAPNCSLVQAGILSAGKLWQLRYREVLHPRKRPARRGATRGHPLSPSLVVLYIKFEPATFFGSYETRISCETLLNRPGNDETRI